MSYMNNHLQPFFARMASIQKKALSALIFFVLLACLLPVRAEQLTALDQKNIRSVVEGQMAAFANDDANKAFSYAAPNVRQAVGSAARFMTMVRRDYPMVYRPASSTFLQPESLSGEVLQRVHLTDASGNSWLAIYSLEHQKDKSWRITGCSVQENKGRMA